MATLLRIGGLFLLAIVVLFAPATWAQQTDFSTNDVREQPLVPVQAYASSENSADSTLDIAQAPIAEIPVAVAEHPLSGVQESTAGRNVGVRNFLVPSVNVMSQMGIASTRDGISRPTTLSYLTGNLDLNHVSDRSDLFLRYTGGGMFSSYVNSAIQDLEFTYDYNWQRWRLLVGGQANYLSESPFGFGGIGGLAFLSGDLQVVSLLSGLTPNQTIPTIIVPRLSSAAVAQVEYKLSPRSSWTASASVGMLDFLGAGYINSNQGQFQTGYNYQLSPQSTVAMIYRFDAFRYTYLHQTIEDHVAELAYGRYVTGRLSFQVAAGPSEQVLRGTLTGNSSRLSWAVDSVLNYQLDRTTLLFSYHRLVSGGSGVLVGAQTGQVEATLERKLNPKWQLSSSLGYATNRSLVPVNTGNGHYNSWYAVVRANHQLRPTSSLFMSYGARLQVVPGSACLTPTCGTNSVGHEISAGINFGLRPLSLR